MNKINPDNLQLSNIARSEIVKYLRKYAALSSRMAKQNNIAMKPILK